MTKDLSEKVFEKTKEENIKPKPKWEFLAKNYFLWGIFVGSILIGSLAFSAMLFLTEGDDLKIYSGEKSFSEYFILALPYFWILATIILIFIAIFNFKNTRTGYRYNPFLILFSSLFLSIVFGFFFYKVGFAEKFESIFSENIPVYRKAMERRMEMRNDPENGTLSGKIVDTKNFDEESQSGYFMLEDWGGKEWRIEIDKNTTIAGRIDVKTGIEVKILGEKSGDKTFDAERITPWNGGGNGMGRRKN